MAEPPQPPESQAGASSSTTAVPSQNPPDVAGEDESDPDFDDLDGISQSYNPERQWSH